MSSRIAVQIGQALLVPFAMLCGVATAAGPLPALPTASAVPLSLTTAPSLASVPSAASSMSAMPVASGASFTSSSVSQDSVSAAALPGLDGLKDQQGKAFAMRAKSSTSAIRPIRVPGGNLPPIILPGL